MRNKKAPKGLDVAVEELRMVDLVSVSPDIGSYMMHDPVTAPFLAEAQAGDAQEWNTDQRQGGLQPVGGEDTGAHD